MNNKEYIFYLMTIVYDCLLAHVWRMQAAYWLLSGECRLYIGSHWRMQAVYWLLSGEHRLYIGSCLQLLAWTKVTFCVLMVVLGLFCSGGV